MTNMGYGGTSCAAFGSPEAVLTPPGLLSNDPFNNVGLLAAHLADLVHLDHRRLHRTL